MGSCGCATERWALVTASAFSRPAATCGIVDTTLEAATEMRPPTRSVRIGGVPLYGTCTRRTPAVIASSATVMWPGLPLPDEPNSSSSGRVRASASSAFIDRTGSAGCTTSTLGEDTTIDTAARSFSVS